MDKLDKDYILLEKQTSLSTTCCPLWYIGESSERKTLKRFGAQSVTWDVPPRKVAPFSLLTWTKL